MGSIEDITEGLPQEPPQPTEAVPVEIVGPPEPETIPYRGRDGDFQIPADAAAIVSAALGFDNPAALINKLRMADESDTIYRESRDALRKAHQAQRQPQQDSYYQQQEAQRQFRPQAPQPQYRQEPQADDPLELIRAMSARLQEVDQRTATMNQYVEWQIQQAQQDRYQKAQSLEREVRSEYGKLVSDLQKRNVPDWKIPDQESLLSEAENMGMFSSNLTPAQMVERTYKMLYGDYIAQEAVKTQMQKMRDPKARVSVPSGPSSSPPPPAPPNPNSIAGMEAAIGGLRFSEIELPRERR